MLARVLPFAVLLVALSLLAACGSSEGRPIESAAPTLALTPTPTPQPPPVMDGDQSDIERQGALIGVARSGGSAAIIARVNGHPITAADVADGRARVAANLEWMRDTISRIVPDEEFSKYISAVSRGNATRAWGDPDPR